MAHKLVLSCAGMALLLFSKVVLGDEPTPAWSDGVTDATRPIQQLLNAASQHGGEVRLAPGQYLLTGPLTVPPGVTLRGSGTRRITAAVGQRFDVARQERPRPGRRPAAIELQANAAVEGMTMLWPEQTLAKLTPYPWAIHGGGMHDTVENVTS